LQLVFNGEIYNYRELRARLGPGGHQFRSHSDTEVIAHLTRRRAPAVSRISKACSRSRSGTSVPAGLTLARRPRRQETALLLPRDDRRIAFASEMKSFFAHPEIRDRAEPRRHAVLLLYGYAPAPATLYRRVFQLEPGHGDDQSRPRPCGVAPIFGISSTPPCRMCVRSIAVKRRPAFATS